ncbi:hypothetical protein J6590_093760, partial [Homalodisca vitripennis]
KGAKDPAERAFFKDAQTHYMMDVVYQDTLQHKNFQHGFVLVVWPSRSPDLSPLDFFLWGAIKDKVYRTPLTTPEDMRERIRNECSSIGEEGTKSACATTQK